MEVTSTTYLTAGVVSDELHKMFSSTVDDCLLSTLHVFMKMKPLFKMFFCCFFRMSVYIISSPGFFL